MYFSVIVPAYNCGEVIVKTIEALKKQSLPAEDIEVIVVDDASTDGTRAAVERYAKDGSVKYLRNDERLGSGVARNRGLENAKGEYIMFLDADNVPEKDCLGQHMDFHKRFPGPNIAVLGNPQYPPEVKATPLMRLDDVGLAFRRLKHGDICGWADFSSMNISLKRSFIDSSRARFDEKVFARTVGFEDTELGFRLHKKGLKIVYNEKAVSYHYHFRTPAQFLEKVQRYGEAFRLWLESGDRDLLKETKFIGRFLPERGPKLSVRYTRYALQKIFVNGSTINALLSIAKNTERNSEIVSSFLYRRLFNYYFRKGYYGNVIPKKEGIDGPL
ncbi:MAG: glycosyltransferase family 2 protein [Candidatus Omnitrophica bacterium]|nr:glycosyltransferase family 2 protein [Candidatus Omnitrophota bacterium]